MTCLGEEDQRERNLAAKWLICSQSLNTTFNHKTDLPNTPKYPLKARFTPQIHQSQGSDKMPISSSSSHPAAKRLQIPKMAAAIPDRLQCGVIFRSRPPLEVWHLTRSGRHKILTSDVFETGGLISFTFLSRFLTLFTSFRD